MTVALSPVPPPGLGVCRRCHGPAGAGHRECFCCARVGGALGEGAGEGPLVVPMAICSPGDELHGALRRYKDAPSITARRHYCRLLADVVEGFFRTHGRCLARATGGWEMLSVVPSSTRGPSSRGAVCPFDHVVRSAAALARLPRLELRRGPDASGHLVASPRAFETDGPAAGRVLLVDDTWVTGARARSAAAALTSAGATVVGIVVVALCVGPAAGGAGALWWAWRCAGVAGVAGVVSGCGLPGCPADGPGGDRGRLRGRAI